MRTFWIAMCALVGFGFILNTAEAKRMGGGGSFGGKSQYSQPQNRSAAQDSKSSAQGAPAAAPGQAATAAQAGSRTPRGGMIGGLLAGGLLGALLFGGAFDQINFADILLFGVGAFVLYKLFRLFAARRTPMAATTAHSSVYERDNVTATAHGGIGQPGSSSTGASQWFRGLSQPASSSAIEIPKGLDPTQMLDEAQALYIRLQKAWDEGDMAGVREFVSDKVFGEIQDQYRARRGDNRTEIVDLQKELIAAHDLPTAWEASVLFDTQMIEYDEQSALMPQPQRVREVWHFTKSKSALRKQWMLDGIQQVEYT